MKIETVYEVQGVYLTEAAIETLKKFQLHDNSELKSGIELLNEILSNLVSQMDNSTDEKTKELASLATRLNAFSKKIKKLSKP